MAESDREHKIKCPGKENTREITQFYPKAVLPIFANLQTACVFCLPREREKKNMICKNILQTRAINEAPRYVQGQGIISRSPPLLFYVSRSLTRTLSFSFFPFVLFCPCLLCLCFCKTYFLSPFSVSFLYLSLSFSPPTLSLSVSHSFSDPPPPFHYRSLLIFKKIYKSLIT